MKYLPLGGLFALCAVAALGASMIPAAAPAFAPPAAAELHTRLRATDAELARLRALQAELEPIAASLNRYSPPLTTLVASRPPASTASTQPVAGGTLAFGPSDIPQERQLSLIYAGDGFLRAVIDGNYVRRGDTLPDGGRITHIGRNTVIVHDAHGRQTLSVPDPRPASAPRQGGMR
ncbi:hypothetical protein [Pseudothauera lacus]|uniref:Type IV pilus biogenesis protein PilP n=1 Tax=Pseudothauera lacus TaxID=2136175 RepID=A0A2T4IIM9_9RHOO|nr:hypothetical protein [Pseudothauera lacus]PTD97623.1 hypothetical protein C8261_02805 [Pseudothauera lacus]